MRSVDVAELKKRLSTYLNLRQGGRGDNHPRPKSAGRQAGTISSEDASEEELLLVSMGAMRLPEAPLDVDELWKMPKAKVAGSRGVEAVLEERDEAR